MSLPISYSNKLKQQLFSHTDNSTLVLFRIVFGFLLFYHCVSFVSSGQLYENFIQPPFTFTYIGFEFLQPLPGHGMYFYFGGMAILALMIMTGTFYRVAITGFTFLWLLVYLMQKSAYNNHYYLMLLLCMLMCFMPANTYCSVDASRRPDIKTLSCPRWIYLVFIAQTAIIYFYAAINKLNADWLSGKFIAIQLERMHTRRITGDLYANEFFQQLIIYGGFLFDLMIVPLLVWKKTRYYAFFLFCGFHIFNSYTFHIGIFPWLSIAMGLFFLAPEKIRQVFFKDKVAVRDLTLSEKPSAQKTIFVYGLFIYLLFQLLLPMRSWFYPGDVFWTEEGYRMSWKMMLRTKSGKIKYKVVDPASGRTWIHDPALLFSPAHVNWLAICPDISWQYAQRLESDFRRKGFNAVAVYAIDSVSLNRNASQLLLDSSVNLAGVEWTAFSHSPWIMPYRK